MLRRLAVSAVALVAAGAVFTSPASAHVLSESKAKRYAQYYGANKVKKSDGDYYTANAYSCKRGVPHRVSCRIGYHTRETFRSRKYDCIDYVEMSYKAHGTSEARDYTVYARRTGSSSRHYGGC